jgi:hypothetical protein
MHGAAKNPPIEANTLPTMLKQSHNPKMIGLIIIKSKPVSILRHCDHYAI